MKIDELIRDLKYTVLHLPWSQIRKGADEVVDRVVATLKAQQTRIDQLEAELKEEMYRHDRLQDFEVAEAQVLAKLRQERRWIPVGERLPTPYVDVITCRMGLLGRGCATGIECITIQREDALVWGKDLATWKSTVTHWMPLPESPKEDP